MVKPKVANWKEGEFEFKEVIELMNWDDADTIYSIGDNGSILIYKILCSCFREEDTIDEEDLTCFDHPMNCIFKTSDFSTYDRKFICEETKTVQDSLEDFFNGWLLSEE